MQTNLLLNTRVSGEMISDELREFFNSIGTLKSVEKDSYLLHEGDEAHEIFVIKKGLFQVSKLTPDGKELILRICKKDDIIGELTLFSHDPTYLLSAKALKSSEVYVIRKDELESTLLKDERLSFEFMKWTHNHMRKFQSKIRDLLMNGKKGALYSTLIRLSNSYGVKKENGILIDLVLTNRDLANFCATTRESVNRMLVQLRKNNVIEYDKAGKILIKDLQYLKDAIGCENCPIEICNIN